jgi:hypothetical protein
MIKARGDTARHCLGNIQSDFDAQTHRCYPLGFSIDLTGKISVEIEAQLDEGRTTFLAA